MKCNDSNDQPTHQEVSSDANENSVQYHVTKTGKDIWVVNDFGRVSRFGDHIIW